METAAVYLDRLPVNAQLADAYASTFSSHACILGRHECRISSDSPRVAGDAMTGHAYSGSSSIDR